MRDRPELLFARQGDIVREYERGFVGAYRDLSARERLRAHIEDIGGHADGGDACRAAGFVADGAGKLSLPFMAAMQLYSGVLPGGQQLRGDCVSWSTRTALLVSYCASLMYGPNAERNAAPKASAEAIASGLFSTEMIYVYRGYDGDGWSCSAAADVVLKSSGMVLRQAYPELGLDLTTYSPATAGKWGRTPPPAEVRQMTSQYQAQNATVCTTWEQVRDMLANGFALSTCGLEAWSHQRDEFGVCRRSSQTWAHAISVVAADDREETKRKYGSPLLLYCNSWGEYLSGGRRILGTDIDIPPGCFWSRWDDCSDRNIIALSTGKGWQAKRLPDWGLGGIV